MKALIAGAARARSAAYCACGAAFTLLMSVVTVRAARDLGDGRWLDALIALAITTALAWQTRRWYRRARAR